MTKKTKSLSESAPEVMSKPYTRRLIPDETGGFVASILEFPGCFAEGASAEDALRNLEEAAASWVEVALSHGYEFREPVSFEGCSGKIALRIPRGLHKQVAELAELEDTSVNQLLVMAISEYIGSKKTYETTSADLLNEIKTAIRDSLVHFYRNSSLFINVELPTGEHFQRGLTTPSHPSVATRAMIAF